MTILKDHYNLDKIVVSEHPESEAVKEELEDRYANFERSRRNSHNLIKNADYIFAHYSTSIGMAIYFDKPIILLIDKELTGIQHIKYAIETYSRSLKLPIVDMDNINLEILSDYNIDKSLYSNFVNDYMRDNYKINENSYHYAIKRIISDLKK